MLVAFWGRFISGCVVGPPSMLFARVVFARGVPQVFFFRRGIRIVIIWLSFRSNADFAFLKGSCGRGGALLLISLQVFLVIKMRIPRFECKWVLAGGGNARGKTEML